MKSPTTQEAPRSWNAAATLRTSARRVEAAQAVLEANVLAASAEGMSARQIGRHIGRSHRWVLELLAAAEQEGTQQS